MADDGRSVQELFSTAFSQFGKLLRSELQLARAEVSANISTAGTGMALVGAGACAAIAALVLFLMAISVALQESGMSEAGAHLLAAVLGIAAGGALVWAGLSKLRTDSLAPTVTAENLSKDASAIKEQLK